MHDKPEGYHIPTHPSLMTPILVMGGEREPMMMWGIICGTAVMGVWHWVSAVVGVAAWVIGAAILRAMAERDPQMVRVAIRAMRYRRMYPAAGAHPGRPRVWYYPW